MTVVVVMTAAACGGKDSNPQPSGPTPLPGAVTVNVYILPDAQNLGANAFGDHPLVIYKGERMHWRNIDQTTHALVADTTAVPDFLKTDPLEPGAEQSFIMTKTGTTTFHCTIHPSMIGTLIVQEP